MTVTFVPPGDRSNPYPMHAWEPTFDWEVKVNSVKLNADADFSTPPRSGHQYVVVNLSMTSLSTGNALPSQVVYDIADAGVPTEGGSATKYEPFYCPSSLPPIQGGTIYAGETATGNVCYEVASYDVSSLELGGFYAYGPPYSTYYTGQAPMVWFGLE